MKIYMFKNAISKYNWNNFIYENQKKRKIIIKKEKVTFSQSLIINV